MKTIFSIQYRLKHTHECDAIDNHFIFKETFSVSGQIALPKKQGVSGQSLTLNQDVQIHIHEKDFRSKALIKEAIMENDFLQNLSPSQVGCG